MVAAAVEEVKKLQPVYFLRTGPAGVEYMNPSYMLLEWKNPGVTKSKCNNFGLLYIVTHQQ